MANNYEWIGRAGITSEPFVFTIKDNNNLPINITGWNVKVYITKKGSSSLVVNGGSCVVFSDQTTYKGKAQYNWQSISEVQDPGEYEVEIVGIDQNFIEHSYPTRKDQPFAIIILLKRKKI